MYEIFRKLLDEKGVTVYRVAKETEISSATFTEWKNGNYTPKQDKLQKIADYFGVTLDYLVGNENLNNKTENPIDKIPKNIRAATRQLMDLDEENQKMAIEMINFLSQKGDEAKNKW